MNEPETVVPDLDQKPDLNQTPDLHQRRTPRKWTKKEDAILMQVVQESNNIKWTTIATHLEGRSGKQCQERWKNHLRPDLKKGPWSIDEDFIIFRLQKSMGNNWTTIATHLPGRTHNDVKNRWSYSNIMFHEAYSLSKGDGDSTIPNIKASSTPTKSKCVTSTTKIVRSNNKDTKSKPKVVKKHQPSRKVGKPTKKTITECSKPDIKIADNSTTPRSRMKTWKQKFVTSIHDLLSYIPG